jgi:phosphotriesterase-related protein
MIQTVLGEISENELGVCSSHEHVFIDMRNCVEITGNEKEIFYDKITMSNRAEVFADPYAILDNALLEANIDDGVAELEYFKAHGGQTIVDCTPDEIGRDPLAL